MKKPFGKRLKDLMYLRDVSPNDICESLGVHYDSVMKWRSGRLPKAEHQEALADLLGTTKSYLVDGIQEQTKGEPGMITREDINRLFMTIGGISERLKILEQKVELLCVGRPQIKKVNGG